MKQCSTVILGGVVLVVLAGCGTAARDASNSSAPLAQQVTLSTTNSPAYIGTVLRGSYQYTDAEGDVESGTAKVWLRDGQAIEGATQDNYTATIQDVGKKVQFRVTPAAATGKSPGEAVVSSAIMIENSPPAISDLVIGKNLSGPADTGDVLTASYSFQDLDGDGEGVSIYQWRRNGVAIGGETKRSYTLTLGDAGATITAAVTPFAHTGASPGLPVVSNAVKVVSPNVVLTVSAGLKQLHFRWASVPGASFYRVSYTPDGASGFVLLAVDSDNLTATDYDWDIAVHRINWPKAQFMLEACDSSGCVQSARISAVNVMLGAIGYFKASNTAEGGYFGVALALSADGNTLAVGAFGENSAATGVGGNQVDGCTAIPVTNCAGASGAVYVYTRANGSWAPQPTYIKASNTEADDYFGYSLALNADGSTLAVGVHYESSAATGVNNTVPGQNDNSARFAGAVYIYARSNTTWSQQAYVKASNTGVNDMFGISIALSADGNTLAAGAWGESSAATGVNNTVPGQGDNSARSGGAVYVFTRSGTTWSQQAYVKASNTGAEDIFGYSLALSADGNTLAVGASGEASAATGVNNTASGQGDNSATGAGAVYIYARSDTMWSQQAYVKASNTGAGDYFGESLALSADGNTLAVGAHYEASAATGVNNTAPGQGDNSAGRAGAVYVYARSDTTWSQQAYVKASNTGAEDFFGRSLALSADGDTLAVGASGEASAATGVNNTAPGQSDNSATYAGAVYIFTRSDTTWSQQAYVKASNTGTGDYFGGSLALSADGNTLAVGATGEASAATGVNNTESGQGDNSAPAAGAVYLY